MSRIIIIGGGFAGLKVARSLNNTSYDILLIDRINHHQFQPLFYQVATAGLEPSSVSFPLRNIFHNSKNVRIRLTEVRQLISSENKIVTDIGDFSYDYLIIATGATTNFFKNDNLASKTFPMKSTLEAINIRHRMIQNFEDALSAKQEDREALLHFVVVGGGPTGVELAGAIAEMKKHVFPKDYPELDFSMMKIVLLEGSDKTLGSMSEPSQKKSRLYLEELGVKVMVNTRVKDYDGENIILDDGKLMKARMVIWAAGVTGNTVKGLKDDVLLRGNRLKVDRFSKVEGYPNIYAIGDIAIMTTPKYPNGHPQLANVALSQAKVLSRNFKSLIKKKPLKEFEYHDKGSMATVGKHKAVVDLPFIRFQGLFAWFVWMGLHLLLLMGMKNKLFVFIDWVIAYTSNDSTLRLIFYPVKKTSPGEH